MHKLRNEVIKGNAPVTDRLKSQKYVAKQIAQVLLLIPCDPEECFAFKFEKFLKISADEIKRIVSCAKMAV